MRLALVAAISALVGAVTAAGILYLAAPQLAPRWVATALEQKPELVVAALEAAEENRLAQEDSLRNAAVMAHEAAIFASPTTPSVGPADAKVEIVEFFDYRCPYCKKVAPDLHEILAENDDVRLIYKELPILGPESVIAAKVALAAHLQGRYQEMHEALIGLQGQLNQATILSAAEAIGLDIAKLTADMESEAVIAELRAVRDLAGKLGVDGTPAFIFGRSFVGGAIPREQMEALMAAAREG